MNARQSRIALDSHRLLEEWTNNRIYVLSHGYLGSLILQISWNQSCRRERGCVQIYDFQFGINLCSPSTTTYIHPSFNLPLKNMHSLINTLHKRLVRISSEVGMPNFKKELVDVELHCASRDTLFHDGRGKVICAVQSCQGSAFDLLADCVESVKIKLRSFRAVVAVDVADAWSEKIHASFQEILDLLGRSE